MKRGMGIKGDGNGGWDINVQRGILVKYGLPALLTFLLVTGLGSRLGSELWDLLLENRRMTERVTQHDREIAEGKERDAALAEQVQGLRVEVRQDLREIKNEVRAIARARDKDG